MNCEAICCSDRATVQFAIYPDGFDGPRILAEISEGRTARSVRSACQRRQLLQACQLHFGLIEAVALERHRIRPLEATRLPVFQLAT